MGPYGPQIPGGFAPRPPFSRPSASPTRPPKWVPGPQNIPWAGANLDLGWGSWNLDQGHGLWNLDQEHGLWNLDQGHA